MAPNTPEHQSMPVPPSATLPAVAVPEQHVAVSTAPNPTGDEPGSVPAQTGQLHVAANVTTASSAASAAEQAAEKAKQLVTAYAQDPFQLATLYADLKADYLAHEHGIVIGGGKH